jgi:hypothetical protein
MLKDKLPELTAEIDTAPSEDGAVVRGPGEVIPSDEQVKLMLEFRAKFCRNKETNKVDALLNRLYAHGNSGADIGVSARSILITGPSGCGKTRTLRRMEKKHPPYRVDGNLKQPIVFVDIRKKMTTKAVLEQMLLQLGVPPASFAKQSEGLLMERVANMLRQQETKVVIFDEVQHLTETATDLAQFCTTEFAKSMLNAAVCGIAFSGTEAAADLYDALQVKRRSMGRVNFKAFDWHNPDDQYRFRTLLQWYGERVPLKEKTNLGNPDGKEAKDHYFALRIHWMAEGVLGKALDFVVMATEIALHNGLEKLTREVFSEAAELSEDSEDEKWFNPFEVDDAYILSRRPPPAVSPKLKIWRGKRSLKQSDV